MILPFKKLLYFQLFLMLYVQLFIHEHKFANLFNLLIQK